MGDDSRSTTQAPSVLDSLYFCMDMGVKVIQNDDSWELASRWYISTRFSQEIFQNFTSLRSSTENK